MSASLVQAFLMQMGQPQSGVLPTRSTSLQAKKQARSWGTRIRWNSLIPVVDDREKSMTVKMTNRSHRVVYMVLLLLVAVALTSALVLAGERNWGSKKQEVSERIPANALAKDVKAELTGWRCA